MAQKYLTGLLRVLSSPPATITRWWTRWPKANIGERTDNLPRIDIDLLDLAVELAKRAEAQGVRQRVLVQGNVAGETQKAGCAVADAPALVRQAAAQLILVGDGLGGHQLQDLSVAKWLRVGHGALD